MHSNDRIYCVRVTERHGVFNLHIPELGLAVRGHSFDRTYSTLMERLDALLGHAAEAGLSNEVPAADASLPIRPPQLRYKVDRAPVRGLGSWE
jgi:hypothetical protein